MTQQSTDRESRGTAMRAMRLIAQERWAIVPETLKVICDIAMRDHVPDFDAVLAKRGQRLDEESRTIIRGRTAIIPVMGPIFRYANIFTMLSGASSISMLALDLRKAIESPAVGQIILDIDSPGGMVSGVSEFAQMIRNSPKPVVAYVGNLAASAGYWIASSASKIVINNTAQLGSIGVVSTVYIDKDESVVEIVSKQSPLKRADATSEEGRAHIQEKTDELADIFIETVAANRGYDVEKVLSDFGRGGLLIGKSAVTAGMADRIGSLEELIASFK